MQASKNTDEEENDRPMKYAVLKYKSLKPHFTVRMNTIYQLYFLKTEVNIEFALQL